MSLTYQPFAETPSVTHLASDLAMNVPDRERTISAAVGTLLLAKAASKHGLAKWVLLAIGAGLAWRGWSGHCVGYDLLKIDRRHV